MLVVDTITYLLFGFRMQPGWKQSINGPGKSQFAEETLANEFSCCAFGETRILVQLTKQRVDNHLDEGFLSWHSSTCAKNALTRFSLIAQLIMQSRCA